MAAIHDVIVGQPEHVDPGALDHAGDVERNMQRRASRRRRDIFIDDDAFQVADRQVEPVEQRPHLLEHEFRAVFADDVDDAEAQADVPDKAELDDLSVGCRRHARALRSWTDPKATSRLISMVIAP